MKKLLFFAVSAILAGASYCSFVSEVNISTPNGKYVIEDNIENSIQRVFKIFQAEGLYGNLS